MGDLYDRELDWPSPPPSPPSGPTGRAWRPSWPHVLLIWLAGLLFVGVFVHKIFEDLQAIRRRSEGQALASADTVARILATESGPYPPDKIPLYPSYQSATSGLRSAFGRVPILAPGTPVRVLQRGAEATRVRVVGGMNEGREGWVSPASVGSSTLPPARPADGPP